MAKKPRRLEKRGNYYYKYVTLWNPITKVKKQIPIKLAHISQYKMAQDRKSIVEHKVEQLKIDNKLDEIANWVFDWDCDEGVVSHFKEQLTLSKAVKQFLNRKGCSHKTINMNRNSFNHWIEYLEPHFKVEQIQVKHLKGFVDCFKGFLKEDQTTTSINIDVRAMRTLLYWLKDNNEIAEVPSFKRALKECPVIDDIPIYITEVEFDKIMNSDWCLLYNKKRDWYKEVFQLYWDIGARLSEPFNGKIIGNYLEVPAHLSKNGYARSIRVTSQQANTILKLQKIWIDNGMSDNHITGYSKMFKKALKFCGIAKSKHFHCLRHSFALRRRIETNGNYQQVQKDLGHRSVQVTEKYQRCDERKLKDDFPSLAKLIESTQNGQIKAHSTRVYSTMNPTNGFLHSREIN